RPLRAAPAQPGSSRPPRRPRAAPRGIPGDGVERLHRDTEPLRVLALGLARLARHVPPLLRAVPDPSAAAATAGGRDRRALAREHDPALRAVDGRGTAPRAPLSVTQPLSELV